MAGAVLAVVSILLAAAGIVYSGMLNVAADKPHWPLTERLMQTVRSRSIEARSEGLGPIPDLEDSRRILTGAGQYGEMCAICHLAPGMADTPLRQGLNPRPPELAGYRMDPRTSFWIVKHGKKMTGMPAWGPSHDDDMLWSIALSCGSCRSSMRSNIGT